MVNKKIFDWGRFMKITKLPDVIDPVSIIKKKIDEKNKNCPFCGSVEKHIPTMKTWYGKQNPYSWWLFGEKHHWQISCYHCKTCGAEWENDPFPTDIGGI